MTKHAVRRITDSSRVMAEAALHTTFEALPRSTILATRNDLLDTLGVALGGRQAPGCPQLTSFVLQNHPAQQATVWGSGCKTSAAEAAWANGTMAHALDFDDTHDPSVLHAGVSVIPAALAAAELAGNVDGKKLITAITVGLDWVCRMGAATSVGPIESGWMYTSLFGYFGATAAVGHILNLNPDQLTHALGIVYSQASGNTQCMIDGSLTKRMQPGFAARAGVSSVQLALAGITGTTGTFDGQSGLFRTYLSSQYDRNTLLDKLGTRFLGDDLSFKPYPACRYTHTAIEAALNLLHQHTFDISSIDRIEVGVNEHAYRNVCTPLDIKTSPRTIVDAQFSIPYCIAAALVKGRVFLSDFTADALLDPQVLEIAKRVIPHVDAEIQAKHARDISPAHIRIHLSDKTILTMRQPYAKGGPDNPMSWDELTEKFRHCAEYGGYRRCSENVNEIIESIYNFEAISDVTVLAGALRKNPT